MNGYEGYMKDIRIRKSPKSLILYDLVTLNYYYHGASGSCGSLIPALDITFCSLLVVGVDLVAPAKITTRQLSGCTGSDQAATKTCRLHKLSGVLRDSLLTA
jgi:hypothetical protein